MDKETAIKEAKKVAKEDYDNLMIEHGCHDPNYVRPWRKQVTDNGEAYALDGTPDKAFVLVYPKFNKVLATRPDGSVIKSFIID